MVGGMRGQVNKSECVGGLSTREKIFHFASENQVAFGPSEHHSSGVARGQVDRLFVLTPSVDVSSVKNHSEAGTARF